MIVFVDYAQVRRRSNSGQSSGQAQSNRATGSQSWGRQRNPAEQHFSAIILSAAPLAIQLLCAM